MSSPTAPDVSSKTVTDGSEPSSCGRVKWFNNKAGYGFITISSDEQSGEDVFVHHSAIQVGQEQYRYLVQGEYVEFKLCNVKDDNHRWQAGYVKGMNGGKLMCETRLETRENRTMRRGDNPEETKPQRPPREEAPAHYRVRSRGPGPREGEEWMLVRTRSRQPRQTHQSPTREVLKSRQNRAPFRDGDN